ncbi:hypothetical protein Bca4012_035090 [Brassica carinata]
MDRPGSCSEVKFLWPYSVNHNYRCIYRVPCGLRSVNPEAYTPQMLLIGPLHHYKKAQAVELSKTDVSLDFFSYMYYNKMEVHKTKYLENIALTYGDETVEEFRSIIKRDEQVIRACYAEPTDSINSDDFVEMMLHDSVFILVFFMHIGPRYIDKTGDFLFDEPCYQYLIFGDLILLENQLPYALLESLFEPFYTKFGGNTTFCDVILQGFEIQKDCLIETENDVDLLVNKGIIKNCLGRKGSIAEMVNRLSLEIVDEGCHYYDISESLSNHYENSFNRSVATLRRVYFKDLWTGTAHVGSCSC